MKIRLLAGGFVLGAAMALIAAQAVSQDSRPQQQQPTRPAQPSEEEMARIMEQWQQIASPGEHHRLLDRFVGQWKSRTKVMSMGPEPMVSEGTASFEWILDGRFLRHEQTGTFMGMPMKGLGVLGYDNFKRKYSLCWMDNLGTAMLHAEGLLNMTGDQITYYGTMDEWMTGEHDKAVKYVYRFVDDDHMIFEMHDLGIVPGETKVVEVKCERVKK